MKIRKSQESDLGDFFLIQKDKEAVFLAAFTPKNPDDKEAFMLKYKRFFNDETINMYSIISQDKVIGYVIKYMMNNKAEITYALNKEYWGKGLTTKAVELFLVEEEQRPIYGRVAFDNIGSQKILEKTGFLKIGEDEGYANAREQKIIEFVYCLGW